MQPKSSWKFTTDLESVDFPRIIKEANEAAGGAARCIRVTIDGKVYTLVAYTIALVDTKQGRLLGYVPKRDGNFYYRDTAESNPDGLLHPFRSDLDRIKVPYHDVAYGRKPSQSVISHVLYLGDVVEEHLDVVKTTVEVF